jgi:sphingomyelin phosphodiesterase acid-like 3
MQRSATTTPTCGDYQLDDRSEFLAAAGKTLLQGLPSSQQQSALQTFALGGYYSASLPPPMQKTRLVVLNHLFMSRRYSSCGGAPDPQEIDEQLAWVRQELTLARRNHDKVWIMGHIPPGVDPYSTIVRMTNVCGGQPPVMFLSSGRLENLLVEFDDVVELGIFGHTHMDELRLLKPEAGGEDSTALKGVAIKMVPSISPIDGNNPSFTVARIDPASAMLDDYQVFSASNQTGVDATWLKEYDYSEAFHESAFSAPAVAKMIAEFQADPGAKTKESQDYIRYFLVGDRSAELKAFWSEYVCALSNISRQSFTSCVCSTDR